MLLVLAVGPFLPDSVQAQSSLASELLPDISAQIELSEYEIHWQSAVGAYMAPNRAQNLRFRFQEDGVTVTQREPTVAPSTWSATITLEGYGRAISSPRGTANCAWCLDGSKASVLADDMAISYYNSEAGLRQDFLIYQRPPGPGPLRLNFEVQRNSVTMSVNAAEGFMFLLGGQGGAQEMMRYSDLKVFDAGNQPLQAGMIRTDDNHFAIVVNDLGAQYPILVDPLMGYNQGINGAEWDPGPGSTQFGYSVAYVLYFSPSGAGPLAPIPPIGGLLVGAPAFDSGGASWAGKVFYYTTYTSGINQPLSTTPIWTYTGDQPNEMVGFCVADGGRYTFNGAGGTGGGTYPVLLVGAPRYTGNYSEEGAVFAFFPSSGSFSPHTKLDGARGHAGLRFRT